MTVYLVSGPLRYRQHAPGSTFETELTADEERRAVARGAIRVVERQPVATVEGSFTPPDGWPAQPTGDPPGHTAQAGTESVDEPPPGGSLVEGSEG